MVDRDATADAKHNDDDDDVDVEADIIFPILSDKTTKYTLF